MKELIKLTKQYLEEEYVAGDCVLADIETCNYFRDHFKKQGNPNPPASKPVMKQAIAPPMPKQTTTKPAAKLAPITPVQTIDPSEFKKMLSDHFPNVPIIE